MTLIHVVQLNLICQSMYSQIPSDYLVLLKASHYVSVFQWGNISGKSDCLVLPESMAFYREPVNTFWVAQEVA